MIIVLTAEQPVRHEQHIINLLFENGLNMLHIRKCRFTDEEMKKYIGTIDAMHRERLALHSHHYLAAGMGIKHLHFREKDRMNNKYSGLQNDYRLSTSVHTVEDFNALGAEWTYAFLSPVFASISKRGYGMEKNVLDDLKHKNNPNVRLIGLGGIDENNFQKAYAAGADGIALLGGIWQSGDPVNSFIQCSRKGLLF